MDSEKEIVIAFIFKRSGKKQMGFSEFYLTLSMELNWFNPEDSKKLTTQMIQSGLLVKESENVTPGFDISNIKIPSGYQPTKEVLKQEKKEQKTTEKDVLTTLIEKIADKTKKDQKEILEQIKKISEERNITIEVASLIFGKEFDILFDDLHNIVEEKILAA